MEVTFKLHAQATLTAKRKILAHTVGGWVGPRAYLDVGRT